MNLVGQKRADKNTIMIFICIVVYGIIELVQLIYNLPSFFVIKAFFIFMYGVFIIKSKIGYRTNILNHKLYVFLLFWTIISFLIAFQFNYNYLRNQLLLPYLVLPFTFPFLVKQLSITRISSIFRIIHYSNLIYLCFFILFLTNKQIEPIGFTEVAGKYFAYSNIFLMFFYRKVKLKYKYISLIVYIVSLGLSLFYARRAMIFVLIVGGIFTIWMIYISRKSLISKLLILLSILLISYAGFQAYNKYSNSFFMLLESKVLQDSRSSVEEDFFNSMTTIDLIFGKGIGGTFTAKSSDLGDFSNSMQRNGIETGLLDFILKGGVIYLGLLLLLYAKAIFNGFYKSKNIYSKYLAAFVLLHIVELYPSGTAAFNLRFILIWFCITLLFDKQFLNLNENEVNLRYITK